MTDDTFRPTELSDLECYEFLRSQELGRLAYHLLGEVHIVPVNYAVDDDNRLIFRTAEGSKLFGITMNDDVAFEVDQLLGDEAISVIVRGRAHLLEADSAYVAERVRLRPWINTPKFNVVAIDPNEVTGRRLHMHRPWRSMRG